MKNRENIQSITLIAALTAALVICAWIAIPLPGGVPITLQTFAIALCGLVLGAKRGAVSILVYWGMGAVGLPVFSSFGGSERFFAPSGGYVWGFLFLAVAGGMAKNRQGTLKPIAIVLTGLLVCHLCAVVQFAVIMQKPMVPSFVIISMPFLLKDAISVTVAVFAGKRITAALKKQHKL